MSEVVDDGVATETPSFAGQQTTQWRQTLKERGKNRCQIELKDKKERNIKLGRILLTLPWWIMAAISRSRLE